MLGIIITLLIFLLILLLEELLWKRKILHDEYQRKFLHISMGIFMAFWPWLLTWRQIQIFAAMGVAAALIYKRAKLLNGLDNIRYNGYGHFTHPLAVLVTASLTTDKVYFCLAILVMALADGVAAIAGHRYGKNWQYKVFGHTKTVIGSMAFWMTCLIILGIGLLSIRSQFTFSAYITLLIVGPPILTAVENLGVLGLDNLLLPLAVLAMLNIASS